MASGSIATLTAIWSGGDLIDDGEAVGTIINFGGTEAIGGVDFDATVGAGGSQTIVAHGVAESDRIAGGAQTVSSGGDAVFAQINSGGSQYVEANGLAISATVNSGGQQYVLGTADNTIVGSGGTQYLISGTAYYTIVRNGGIAVVQSGGAKFDDGTISKGGVLDVDSGNTASLTTIVKGGLAVVSSGGTAYGTVVKTGGYLLALPGATLTSTKLSGGTVVSTGVLIDQPPTVSRYAGVANGKLVMSGGTEYVLTGGSATANTLAAGAVQYVFSGGFASNTVVSGAAAAQDVFAGATVSNTVVSGAGAVQNVFSGGTVTGTFTASGGQDVLNSGTSWYANVFNGGTEILNNGGISHGASVYALGNEDVADGTAYGLNIEDGGLATDTGVTSGATIFSGGVELVEYGGHADGTVLNSGGYLIVTPNGFSGNSISSGGAVVSTGVALITHGDGAEIYTNLGAGIFAKVAEYVLPGGTATSNTLSGGMQYVLSGTSSATILRAGAGETVSVTGKAINTVVSSGSLLNVAGLGVASGANVHSGGREEVAFLGSASGSTVSSGGYETVLAGGVESGGKIAGGTLEVISGGAISGSVSFTAGYGELVIDSPTMPVATIYGFATGDAIKLTAVPYAASDTVRVATAGVVTVSAFGSAYNLNIAGATVGETNFHFVSGSLLTESLIARPAPKLAASAMAFLRPAPPAGVASLWSRAAPADFAPPLIVEHGRALFPGGREAAETIPISVSVTGFGADLLRAPLQHGAQIGIAPHPA